jgi:hypothetical protein
VVPSACAKSGHMIIWLNSISSSCIVINKEFLIICTKFWLLQVWKLCASPWAWNGAGEESTVFPINGTVPREFRMLICCGWFLLGLRCRPWHYCLLSTGMNYCSTVFLRVKVSYEMFLNLLKSTLRIMGNGWSQISWDSPWNIKKTAF